MKNKIIFKTLMLKGEAGSTIVSMEKTGHVGTADIYTITFNDGSTTEISLENMSAITSVEKTSSTDTEDIYTITCADGSTQTFSVLNHNADIAAMSDDIDTIDARVDNFINSVVPNTVETLWTGSIKDVGDSATLSKAVSNFDYIDLYLLGSADSKYIRVPATQTAVQIQQQNLSDDASSNFLRLWEMGVSISGTTVSITKSIAWAWDDPDNSNPTVTANAQNGNPITRIDGVKVASDTPAEVTDIRVGADGTTYNSAGAAVRGQISDLNDEVSEKVGSVKSYTKNLFDKSKAIHAIYNASGNVVNKPTTWQGYVFDSWTTDFIPCESGDVFYKNNEGVSAEISYFDSNKVFISQTTSASNTFTVPQNNNIAYVCVSIHVYGTASSWIHNITPLDKFMITKNEPLPKEYVPFKYEVVKNVKDNGSSSARPIIFDTDWAYDHDDILALRILLWAERMNMIDLVAIATSLTTSSTIPCLQAFLQYEGRTGLVLASTADTNRIWSDSSLGIEGGIIGLWREHMLELPHKLQTGLDGSTPLTEDSTSMYRRALATSDEMVDIVVTGTLVNIWKLLTSEADTISSMSGYELVAKKVRRLWIMGGKYPSGLEANFTNGDSALSAKYVFENCPCEIYASGYEVGATVITGGNLAGKEDYDPAAKAMLDRGQASGAPSFDPMCALLAVLDDLDIAGYEAIRTKIMVAYDENTKEGGTTTIDSSVVNGNHYYMVKTHPDGWYAHQINSIIEENAWITRKDIGRRQLKEIIPIW